MVAAAADGVELVSPLNATLFGTLIFFLLSAIDESVLCTVERERERGRRHPQANLICASAYPTHKVDISKSLHAFNLSRLVFRWLTGWSWPR